MTAVSHTAPPPPTEDDGSRLASRHEGWLPATGIVAVVLVLGGHLVHGSVPAGRATIATVNAFYQAHHTRIYIGSLLLGWAAFFLVIFAARLRGHLGADGRSVAADLGFAGAAVSAVGLTLTAGIGVALGHQPGRLDPAAVQALHALFFDLFAPLGTGAALLLIGNGVAILRTRRTPSWLGWSAIPIGILALAPEPVGDIAFVGLGLWLVAAATALLVSP